MVANGGRHKLMPDRAQSSQTTTPSRPWWETRPFVAALILLSTVPLLYPPVPPLVDLLGHMGRYRVQLDVATSPWLHDYYDFRWAAIGNLGVDLLVVPLSKLFGLELAVKLIVLAIPPLTVAGFLWVAREVHGRLPPTVLFALPFAYSHPFMFGFVNYALSIALAFLGFGLWLRLARLNRLRLRAILFVPISLIVFFTHTFGWGVLGLLCFSADAVREHDGGKPWPRAGLDAALHASVMALPLLIMLAWRSEIQGGTTGMWFDFKLKVSWVISALRDRWKWFDLASLVVALVVIVEARRWPTATFSRNLAFSALVLLIGFVAMPWMVFGSAYADMRLLPYVIAVALLAIRFREAVPMRTAQAIAIVGLAFFLIRLVGTTWSLAIAAEDQRAKLEALDQVAMGARVASLVGTGCGNAWSLPRNTHLGSMVVVRRHGFSNDQWVSSGVNLLQLRYREAGVFASDPSQLVHNRECPPVWSIDTALRQLPRDRFDYLWLIDTQSFDPRLTRDMELVWRGPDSALYRLGGSPSGRSSTHP
jgi:hypothetical protein